MALTTETAKELERIRKQIKDWDIDMSIYGYNECYNKLSKNENLATVIINFKNELNKILEDKMPDEPILQYYERVYTKLMTLKVEIESVEKQ